MVNFPGLEKFIESSEGKDPPVFAGRQDELDALSHAAGSTWSLAREVGSRGLSKRTRIIHGAPGAGKSSLLSELARRLHASPAETGQPRLLYTTSSAVSEDTSDILAQLENLARLDTDSWNQRLKRVASHFNFSAGAGPFGVGFNPMDATHGRPRTVSELKTRLPADRWQAPVVLAIDEFQNITDGMHMPEVKLTLQSLHEAVHGLPVLLVLAGLGNAPAIAGGAGLTRGLTTTGIGCLEAEEARGLVRGWCRHFGVDPAGHGERLDRLAADTEGWPRHLHFALQALAGEMVRPGVDGQLSGVRWSVVMERNLELRRNYYNRQQSPVMRESAYLVAAVLRDLELDNSRGGVKNSINRRAGSQPDTRWDLPSGMDASEFAGHLVHQGALQENDNGEVVCPIPSFRSFLVKRGEPVPEPEVGAPEPEPRPVDKRLLDYDDPSGGPSPGGF
ncbi:MAG: ATP-binding protein [Rhodobacteraceae bacterium]|nr:ATP-binding protein [Paracoccaceae bacterium]